MTLKVLAANNVVDKLDEFKMGTNLGDTVENLELFGERIHNSICILVSDFLHRSGIIYRDLKVRGETFVWMRAFG